MTTIAADRENLTHQRLRFVLTSLLLPALLLLLLPALVQAQDFAYKTNNGEITITSYTGSSVVAVIPSTLNGLPVTVIGSMAFWPNHGLVSITIPNSVRSIESRAFVYCSLTNVTIPNSVTNIGSYAFQRCTRLMNVSIPDSVPSIGSYVFSFCTSLTNVTIPDSITNIGSFAFSDCTNLTSVTIPNRVTGIGSFAFSGCTRLTSITIPNSVTSVGDSAFSSCGLVSVTIGNSVTSIGHHVFYNCTSLTSVRMSDSVTSIEDFAFFICTSLTNITIPGSVTNIQNYAFDNCSNLTGVYFLGNPPTTTNDSTVFLNADNAIIYYLLGSMGWGATFDGRPTVLWNPQAQTGDGNFGVQANGFGFNITGTSGLVIVLEACTNLASPVWEPLQSCTLTNGSIYFSDPNWMNYPGRFYRLRSP